MTHHCGRCHDRSSPILAPWKLLAGRINQDWDPREMPQFLGKLGVCFSKELVTFFSKPERACMFAHQRQKRTPARHKPFRRRAALLC